MPHFDIVKEICPKKTFRVANVMGTFDLADEKVTEHFVGDIDLPNEWKIGLIVGASGTGKTTIAKELFPKNYFLRFDYSHETILDDMPKKSTMKEIIGAFNSVGFNSPKSWLKPYSVLSNGEKMRCDIARCMLQDGDLFVFDEFTSVVDRNVAKVGSLAIQKSIRGGQKKMIAVTCHYDVEEWLMPDWVFDTNEMKFRVALKKNRESNLPYSRLSEIKKDGGACLVNIII